MANFVTDNTPLPPLKSDAHPPINPTIEVDAADINGLWAALGDVRGVLATEQPVNFVAPFTGAQSRTIPSKLADIVSVKDFAGADPTGATDSSAAVAAAIAALPSSGGMVVFPAGTYKLNLTLTKSGVTLRGDGYGDVNTGLGGTKLVAANAANPVIQIGNGTSTVRGVRITNMILTGDGTNATGDGIYLLGARDVALNNLTVTGFGRNNIFLQSSATLATSGVYMSALTLAAARGASLRAEYGTQFVTNVSIANSHINGWSTVGSYAIYLDGVTLWMSNTYVDVGASGAGNVKLVKSGATNPGIVAANVSFDNTGPQTGITLDVSTWLTKAGRVASAITGNYTINGSVAFSDGTIQVDAATNGSFYQPRFLNARALNSLYFPLDETDIATSVNLSRVNASGSNTEAVVLNAAGFRVPLSFTFPLEGTTNGAVWRDASSGGLRYRFDTRQPSGDHQGVLFTPIYVSPVYGATVTIDASLGNIFLITATNATAFTVANPGNQGGANNAGSDVEVWIINTSGGALGAITWGTAYRLAGAFTAPATGNRRMVHFRQDTTGGVFYEAYRSLADVPN